MGFCGRVHCMLSASSGAPLYQPMYSLMPMTSRASAKGSFRVAVLPSMCAELRAEVMRRVESSFRASLTRLTRNLVRLGLVGVSLETDQRMTEALLRSRRIHSVGLG